MNLVSKSNTLGEKRTLFSLKIQILKFFLKMVYCCKVKTRKMIRIKMVFK